MGDSSRVRVFIACSLDGFIAGPDDDLSWLPAGDEGEDFGYGSFMARVGALLMGRGTYRVVEAFEGAWPYGERPVLVATHRALTPKVPTVRAVSGSIEQLVAQARQAAGELDVYIDGGDLIRQALDAELIDDLTLTLVPVVLGAGHPLFAGTTRRHSLDLITQRDLGSGLVQLVLRPREPKA